MSLWEIVYSFFLEYVFNGGEGYLDNFIDFYEMENNGNYLALNEYLSGICSIISLVAIVLFCVFIIKKIIGIIFRLFTGSSAF